MRTVDLLLVAAFLIYIVWDGARHGRRTRDAEGYMLAGRRMRWWAMGLSIMATQASAITLISTTGQGFDEGMKFLHFYLAIPFAMVFLCATVVPWFHKARVFTAYQYLEGRFDRPTRVLASLIFLVSRALAVGSVMYVPSIVLSHGLGIPPAVTIITLGLLATGYTTIGGNAAVIITDAKQMVVMFAGLAAAVFFAWRSLPHDVGLGGALSVAGATGRLETFRVPASLSEVLAEKYNVFSGLLGGFFLFLGYFGADQEQVQRYLAGSSVRQSRQSLMMSAFAKVPMQFVILMLGVLLYVHYVFAPAPAFFRAPELERALSARPAAEAAPLRAQYDDLVERYDTAAAARNAAAEKLLAVERGAAAAGDAALAAAKTELKERDAAVRALRGEGNALLVRAGLASPDEKKDPDYVFTHFLVTELPVGIAGLVLAAIFAAAMSSLVSPLNSLATSAVVDLYLPLRGGRASERETVFVTRGMTLVWGLLAMVSAFFLGNIPIIEQVNRIGSVVYGSMFGVFILGRLVKRARGAVGWISLASGVASVLLVSHVLNGTTISLFGRSWKVDIEYLWFNLIGFAVVLLVGFVASRFLPRAVPAAPAPGAPG